MKAFFHTNIYESSWQKEHVRKLAFQTCEGNFYGFEMPKDKSAGIRICKGADAEKFGLVGLCSDSDRIKFSTMSEAFTRTIMSEWGISCLLDIVEKINSDTITNLVMADEIPEFANFFLPIEDEFLSSAFEDLKLRYNDLADEISAGLIMKCSSHENQVVRLNNDIVKFYVAGNGALGGYTVLNKGNLYLVEGDISKYIVLRDRWTKPHLVSKEKVEWL